MTIVSKVMSTEFMTAEPSVDMKSAIELLKGATRTLYICKDSELVGKVTMASIDQTLSSTPFMPVHLSVLHALLPIKHFCLEHQSVRTVLNKLPLEFAEDLPVVNENHHLKGVILKEKLVNYKKHSRDWMEKYHGVCVEPRKYSILKR